MRMSTAISGRTIGGQEPHIVLPAYCQYGQPGDAGPLLLTIPHAGREYPADILARARSGQSALQVLEDRHIDSIAVGAIAAGHCTILARRARAVIDLNRHEEEIDHASVAGIPHGAPMRTSAKLRGGLGLVPHHYHSLGDLWKHRPSYAEVGERIDALHRPYHAQVADALNQTVVRHGAAVLVDLHSMPPIGARGGQPSPQVVIGDRFGLSAGRGVAARAAEVIRAHDVRVAINAPYAGGHTLERHGRPERGVHALQIEIDRTLYLDVALDGPGPGVARWIGIVAEVIEALCNDLGEVMPLAAE